MSRQPEITTKRTLEKSLRDRWGHHSGTLSLRTQEGQLRQYAVLYKPNGTGIATVLGGGESYGDLVQFCR
jgi:hypothetical protein